MKVFFFELYSDGFILVLSHKLSMKNKGRPHSTDAILHQKGFGMKSLDDKKRLDSFW